LSCPLFADEWKVIVLLHPLERENIELEESSFIESLLYSYISAMSDIEVLLEENTQSEQTVDYELFGSLNNDGDNTVITLNVKNMATNEIVSYTSSHKNSSEMVLKLRSIVQTLFHEPAASAQTGNTPSTAEAEDITLNAIVGLWRADSGIEIVNFQRDGTTIAFFSSGERMSLKFIIEGKVLKVIQNSPNRERYYQGMSYDIIRELTQKAQPLYFELQLFDGGLTLRGKRIETTAQVGPNGEILLTHNVERATEWKRHTRTTGGGL
jgi:TolB-like protein